ncbi:MAG: DUF4838 domain-containing protein [Planctomycetes bacterium]|nr:DUF4838 domain-containing protein [Planctomycetota bacterium]
MPKRILKDHPDWMGLIRSDKFGKENVGKRIPKLTPCYTNGEMIQFVADKAAAWAALYPGTPKRFNILPVDSTTDCECDKCLALNKPFVKPDIPYCAHPTYYSSDAYYYFVCQVAKKVAKTSPNLTIFALAYANVFAPPRKIDHFPDNVVVQVCSYWHKNLPPEAPKNARMKSYLDDWAKKCSKLESYGYELLNEQPKTWPMPLPLVTATVGWAKRLYKLSALPGGTQGSPEMIQYCPWNFYAYPRVRWDISTDADAILREFFSCYFRKAGDSMLSYYKAAEDYQIRNDASLNGGGYTYSLSPGTFPYDLLRDMSVHLARAEKKAQGWVEKRRMATMREGFNWLIEKAGVGKDRLDDQKAFPVMGPGKPPLTVAINDADILPSDFQRGGNFYLNNSRGVGQFVRFEADGDYILKLSGTGYTEPRHGKSRIVAAYVNDKFSEAQEIPDGKGDYSFTLKATQGIWEVGFKSISSGEGPFFLYTAS